MDKACNPLPTTQLTALEASTFPYLHTCFAHQLIAGASVEQNSIGHTQIIISQDFKWIPEGLLLSRTFPAVALYIKTPCCMTSYIQGYDEGNCRIS
jgi:hypothetical protein